ASKRRLVGQRRRPNQSRTRRRVRPLSRNPQLRNASSCCRPFGCTTLKVPHHNNIRVTLNSSYSVWKSSAHIILQPNCSRGGEREVVEAGMMRWGWGNWNGVGDDEIFWGRGSG
ncbi:unnamed protein product, partial [Prunus brigantina]